MKLKRYIAYMAVCLVMLFGLGNILPCSVNAEEAKTMEITEDDLNANDYETYYYAEGINYTYKGKPVNFISETQFSAGEDTYQLKNKKTTIDVKEDNGTVTVSLENLNTPVGSISGAWNSTFGGNVQIVYQTDIPGKEEVRSKSGTSLTSSLVLENLQDGTYHLTKGAIYEKANEWSPGYDFGDGKGSVTEGYFGVLPDITVTVGTGESESQEGYIGVKTRAKVYDDFENDIWLQYQQKEMKVGDTADLYPWRMEQIVTDTINNDVARPNFNFEIIKGDSVSLKTEEVGGKADKAIVTAEKPGTSIVQVTYDALDYKGEHWGACSEVNTAYAVFTVGETGTAKITANEEFTNWEHYDTIYYTEGDTVPYTFTANAAGAKSVKVTVNGKEIEGDGGSYTADLENRSNIIGIEATDKAGNVSSLYRVIDARFIEIGVKNKVTGEDSIKEGDTAVVSFKGVTMPVYKLATIYNPQYGKNAAYIDYSNEELGSFKGQCSQWDLAVNNSFEVSFAGKKKGDYTFTSDGIHCAWWGDELGSDMVKQGADSPNLNADSVTGVFSVLPDFTIHVDEFVAVPTEKVTLDIVEKVLYLNQKQQLTAKVEPVGTTDKLEWSSSDETVATVDESGLVTAKAEGEAVITAVSGEKKASCKIIVMGKAAPIDDIYFSTYSVPVFSTAQVTARLQPAEAAGRKITWKLEDESGAEVVNYSEDGYTIYLRGLKVNRSFKVSCVTEDGREFSTTVSFYITDYDVDEIFGALKDTDSITLDMKKEIEEIRTCYDAMDKKDKALVSEEQLADLEAAEQKIKQLASDYKKAAAEQLDSYKNLDDYRDAQKAEINKIIADAKKKLEQAEDTAAVDKITADAKKALDAVKTDAQLKAEEAQNKNEGKTPSAPSAQAPAASTPAKKSSVLKANLAKPKVRIKTGRKSVKLTWKKVKKAKGYQIYRSASKNGVYKKVKTVSKTKTSFIDKKVKKNKRYFYKVRAYKKVKGKKAYGKFSKVITIRVR